MASATKQVLRHADAWVRAKLAARRDGVVPFFEGRFAASQDRAALTARTYYEGRQLAETAERHLELDPPVEPIRVVDVGCGYGRLTPYLCDSPYTNSVHGVEPNDDARARATELYPHITFAGGLGQDIPYPDDHFGLAVTWTVLQHVHDPYIDAVARELARIVPTGGYLISCDKTAGPGSSVIHPRPPGHYEAVLGGFELVDKRMSESHTHLENGGEYSVMVFRRREVQR